MAIKPMDVADFLSDALPEFRAAISEHRREWKDEPGLYILLGDVVRFMMRITPDSERLAFARRLYDVTEKMLVEGDSYVQDCFSIEMIEPLSLDPKETEQLFPGVEAILGPAAKKDLAEKREWFRRYEAMEASRGRVNQRLGRAIFTGVGVGKRNARYTVELADWNLMSEATKDDAFRWLSADWAETTGQAHGLTITGPRQSDFQLLRGSIEDTSFLNPALFRGLDDAFFYLTTPHGATPLRLVAVDCPVPAVTRRCRVIEVAPADVLGLEATEQLLREGTRFDEIFVRDRHIVFCSNAGDPDFIQLSFVLGPGSSGRFADFDIADSDIPAAMDVVIDELDRNNQLLWNDIS